MWTRQGDVSTRRGGALRARPAPALKNRPTPLLLLVPPCPTLGAHAVITFNTGTWATSSHDSAQKHQCIVHRACGIASFSLNNHPAPRATGPSRSSSPARPAPAAAVRAAILGRGSRPSTSSHRRLRQFVLLLLLCACAAVCPLA